MSICFLFIANPWPRVKSEGDPANLSCLLFLVSCDSQVLPALKTQEKKLKQQLLGQRQEVQELEMNIESMSIEIREPPSLGNSKVVCGHCHHRGHRNNITKPCELKKCTEYTYCGLKDKHPEYFSKLNSLKVELKKKKATLKEIESQIKSMEDFSTSSEFSFVKNLTPRMYAANPAYKTNKAKLMRDVRALRTFLDGKIPCVTANDSEQLNILISNSKKNLGVSSDGDETYGTKSTIQTKLDFDSSHVSPIKTEVMEGNSDKVSPSFSQSSSRKNRKKKSKHTRHKKAKKNRRRREYSSDSSNSSSEDDTRHTSRHSSGPFPYPFYSFPGQPQGYPNSMPFFYQPLQPYPQTSGIQQGFQLANSENNFVQNTTLYNSVPFGGPKVGSESTSTITSTTKSGVSSLNAGESWSNFDTLVTAAVSCDDKLN